MADRHDQLLRVKLRALMADRGVIAEGVTTTGICAATVAGQVWVLLDGEPGRGLGGAIAYAIRRGADELHVLSGIGSGILARRAEYVRLPTWVWHVEDRALLPALVEPLAEPVAARPEHLELVDQIIAGGAALVVEHGVVAGEVDGLEVCRVVDDPDTGDVRLAVGVGAHDREAFQMLHGSRPTTEALAEVVAAVAAYRRPGAEPHPLNMLARERSLRCRVIAEPGLIGATQVTAAPPPVARTNLKDPTPCVAVATIDDRSVVTVFSTGIDLDVVPFAADARAALQPDDDVPGEALVVVPARDALDVQRRIAAQMSATITVRGIAAVTSR